MVKRSICKIVLAITLMSGSAFAKEAEPFECLAKNIYFEARGEPMSGKIAVAMVTLSRVESSRWPGTICEVVWQPKQFSWTHDGLSDKPKQAAAWTEAKYAANIALDLHKVKSSTHYHNLTVWPRWADVENLDGFINNHMFYE